jgi:hypothetical protein
VLVESKISAQEGRDQLQNCAAYLEEMKGFGRKTLLYITRAYDPKEADEILSTHGETIRFEQLRWHDFYRFLDETVAMDLPCVVNQVSGNKPRGGDARARV